MDKKTKGFCLFFFHDWSPWKITREHKLQQNGWPVTVLEQSKQCLRCNYIKVNIQTIHSQSQY